MQLKVATWNINSVRLRIDLVVKALKELEPDVLCLQETKCPPGQFPSAALEAAGYPHIFESGQKMYNGVAIISKRPLAGQSVRPFCQRSDCRHIAAIIDQGSKPIVLHNLYVPAGGDEPDRLVNEKFGHKLDFISEMQDWSRELAVPAEHHGMLVGDFNIAPLEHDVWSHKDLLKVVSHTPVETEALLKVQEAGQWVDVMRQHIPHPEKLYTWWSYRAKDWEISDRGRRLDHVWATPDLARRSTALVVLKKTRSWPQTSDHVPVMAVFNLG